MAEPRVRDVPAVARAIAILNYLADKQKPVKLAEIAKDLGIIPSTCLHIIRVLSSGQIISSNDRKEYYIGPGTLRLARGFLDRSLLLRSFHDVIDHASARFNITVTIIERVGENFIVVGLAGPSDVASVRVSLGSSFPLMSGAAGKCAAASSDWSERELKARFQTIRWGKPLDYVEWREQVETARTKGYAYDIGNFNLGITSVSVPIMSGQGSILGCLTALGFKGVVDAASIEAIADYMMRESSEKRHSIEKLDTSR